MSATQRTRYLSTEEAAEEYAFANAEMLRRAIKKPGGPPYLKIGKLLKFDRVEMDAWMNDHRQAAG